MLTIFSIPKPFQGHFGIIQDNAIRSWMSLRPDIRIILFGNSEGVAEKAAELGVMHCPEVETNARGTPLLNDVFKQAEAQSTSEILCYANCDIILTPSWLDAVQRCHTERSQFLMIGECWNLDVKTRLPLGEGWVADLGARVARQGRPRGPGCVDYFAFSRGLLAHMPAFAVGRAYFDAWFIWNPPTVGAPVINATEVAQVVHQNHDYGHVSGGQQYAYHGEEAMQNLQMAGGRRKLCNIWDSTHYLGPEGVRGNLGRRIRSHTALRVARLRNHLRVGRNRLKWWVIERSLPVRNLFRRRRPD